MSEDTEWTLPTNGQFGVEYPPMIWDEEIQNWRVHLEAAQAAGWRYDEVRNQWSKPLKKQLAEMENSE